MTPGRGFNLSEKQRVWPIESHMKTITAEELARDGAAILDELADGDILITRGGEIVARLTPMTPGPHAHLIGIRRDKLKIQGDIMSTGATWDAES